VHELDTYKKPSGQASGPEPLAGFWCEIDTFDSDVGSERDYGLDMRQ
jgi:hypothetical protein